MPIPVQPRAVETQIVGRYTLSGEIAAGGMARVRLGRLSGAAGFSRTVAVKQLHAQFASDPDFAAMFVDEARLAARIRHPNVVPTLDVVADAGQLLLVMEYVPGASLAQLLRAVSARGGAIPAPVTAAILSGVLHGLHAAHEATSDHGQPLGIVHRDVSPQNVIVGTDGVPRVLDFGVAKAAGRMQQTRDGQLKGKMAYMAPEQLDGRKAVDRRVDVYAAAVVLWEALTAQRLFQGDSDVEVFGRVLTGARRPPSEVNPNVPRAYDDVTMRGLAMDPEARFPTAREMARALERCGPVAMASEVSDWLEMIAGDLLAERARYVAEVESRSDVFMSPHVETLPESDLHTVLSDVHDLGASAEGPAATIPAPPPPRGVPLVAAAGIGGAAAIAAIALALLLGGRSRGSATPAPSASESTSAAATQTPSSSSVAAPAPPGETTAATASAIASSRPTPPAARTATAPLPQPNVSPPKPDCNPPYTIDASGKKRYKRGCL